MRRATSRLHTVPVFFWCSCRGGRRAIKEESSTGALLWQVEQESSGGPLTVRELEVLHYLALGWDVAHIATD